MGPSHIRESIALEALETPLERAAVIGDVHGCAETLERLLDSLPDDRSLFFVGDLIDRGPSSKEVVQCFLDRKARGVCGNHELWMRSWLRGEELGIGVLRPKFGVAATLRSYGLEPTMETLSRAPAGAIAASHQALFLGLPHILGLEVDGQPWWIVHAGIPPASATTAPATIEQSIDAFGIGLVWNADALAGRPTIDRPVIMGHHPQHSVQDLGHLVAIDTGAGLWEPGRLSAWLLPERRAISVPVPPGVAAAAAE